MPKNEKCYDINDEFNLSKNELHTNDINLASMQYIQMDMKGHINVSVTKRTALLNGWTPKTLRNEE